MPTARKLPSGSYRCQVFAGYEIVDGKKKRRYESFTAPTKREAESLAARWAERRKERPDNITIEQAVRLYIHSRENVLSPSTIRGYNAMVHRFDDIKDIKIRDIHPAEIQMWISDLSAKLTPKTVKNTYGLLTSALSMADPDCNLRIKLPAKIKKECYIPSDDDFQLLLSKVDDELWVAIMLARYYSLREGEICALRSDALSGNVLTIKRVMVHTKENEWVIRERPKTDDSYRFLIISEPLLSALKERGDKIIDCNPNALGNRFRRAVKAAKIKPFTFHSLRHKFATSAAIMGIPDFYAAKMGGWSKNSAVLKNVYQNVRDEDLRKQMNKMNKAMQHDMQHKTTINRKKAAK